MPVAAFNADTFRDLLPLYYRRLFPYKQFFEWVTYGDEKHERFRNREFSFTLEDDIYVRYQSYENVEDMEFAIKKRNPHKIDIGAIYDMQPKHHKRGPVIPLEKELVFDIDMTDYDDVRSCCQGADVCTKCWKFMAIACKILDKALQEDFGYTHLLWVFSGRRGIHCWVCDEDARQLDNSQRGAIAGYLSYETPRYQYAKRDKLHPTLRRALGIIEKEFVEMLIVEQNALGTEEKVESLVDSLPAELSKDLFANLMARPTSLDRWKHVVHHVEQYHMSVSGKGMHQFAIEELMLRFAYPRLDVNVSTGLNHLLKAPFCVHPKSGKVCVPFNPKTVDKFDPSSIPTLSQLVEEVRDFDEKEKVFSGAAGLGKAAASIVETAPEAKQEVETQPEVTQEPDDGDEKVETSADEVVPSAEDVNKQPETPNHETQEVTQDEQEVETQPEVTQEPDDGDEKIETSADEVVATAEGGNEQPETPNDETVPMDEIEWKAEMDDFESATSFSVSRQPVSVFQEREEDLDISSRGTYFPEGSINYYEAKSLTLEQEAAEDAAIFSSVVIRDYKKTSMYKGILVFETFLRKLKLARSQPREDV